MDVRLRELYLLFRGYEVGPTNQGLNIYTVEPLNKGHVGTRSFVLCREVSFIRRLKCIGIIGIGTSRFVLYREVSFIRRLKCIGIIGIGTSRFVLYREVSFIQRLKCIGIIGNWDE